MAWWEESEYDDLTGEEDEDMPEDLRFPTVTVAAREFMECLVSLRLTGRLSSKEVCGLAFWASKSGATGDCHKLAKHPFFKSTGHYQEHFDKAMGFRQTFVRQSPLREAEVLSEPGGIGGSPWCRRCHSTASSAVSN